MVNTYYIILTDIGIDCLPLTNWRECEWRDEHGVNNIVKQKIYKYKYTILKTFLTAQFSMCLI